MEASPSLIDAAEEKGDGYGEVFTRRWVVELILDLAGYTADRDLAGQAALEPACGSGAFLVPMVERLMESARRHGRDLARASTALAAFDLQAEHVEASRVAVQAALVAGGLDHADAASLATTWIGQRDFLLQPPAEGSFDYVLGNPPYVRLEAVSRARSEAYRRACATMGGRADVYVGFYEHGLLALREGGALAFICADRWMRNAYGARLRELVTAGWSVEVLVSMTGVDAFETEVDAYPAITLLRRRPQRGGPLVIEGHQGLDEQGAAAIVAAAERPEAAHVDGPAFHGARLHGWFGGRAAWPHGSPDRLAVIAELERVFPSLENPSTGTKVGIGVATGADRVFVVDDSDVVEPERLLPLALPRDIASGRVEWSGKHLVNPWGHHGLVRLEDWPRLAAYLTAHRPLLAKRHTARNGQWHKTIDRVLDGLVTRSKLYLPDFKDVMFPVLDEGRTYPHHNLYWVISDVWDLRVLGGLLLSDVANLFIEAYSVRMRGGFLRFQAQYLRRIRVPRPEDVDAASAQALADAFEARDRAAATAAALPLYGLTGLPR